MKIPLGTTRFARVQPLTRAFELAYRITHRGGTTTRAGLPPPDATWAMPVVNLVAEERTIKGIYVGTCVPLRDIPRYVDLFWWAAGIESIAGPERSALDDVNLGFDLLHEGKAVGQVSVF